jgi:hypothetical protein
VLPAGKEAWEHGGFHAVDGQLAVYLTAPPLTRMICPVRKVILAHPFWVGVEFGRGAV